MKYFKVTIVASFCFGVPIGLFLYAINKQLSSLIIGLLSGLCFGLIMLLITLIIKKGFKKKELDIVGLEEIIFSDSANHLVNKEGVGGWLILTTNSVLFKSHKLNYNNHELMIQLKDIRSVRCKKLLGIINNQLVIELTDIVYTFVVFKNHTWKEKINMQLSEINADKYTMSQ